MRAAGCVFAEDEAAVLFEAVGSVGEPLDEARSARLGEMLRRRCAGYPLEQVVGWADFCGQRIDVAPAVFVPRRRSTLLAREAIRRLAGYPDPVILDLCCGSGALGFVVAATTETRIELHASDLEPAAVACARTNLARLAELRPKSRTHVYQGSLFQPLPPALRGRVDLLLANAPYVPSAEIEFLPGEARRHEPRVSLDGGSDGLELHRQIAGEAQDWLSPDGVLLIETSEDQAETAAGILRGAGLTATTVTDDDLGATVVVGTKSDHLTIV